MATLAERKQKATEKSVSKPASIFNSKDGIKVSLVKQDATRTVKINNVDEVITYHAFKVVQQGTAEVYAGGGRVQQPLEIGRIIQIKDENLTPNQIDVLFSEVDPNDATKTVESYILPIEFNFFYTNGVLKIEKA